MIFSRSFAIPVSTRPEPLNGCWRLVSLYRLISTSSCASRKRISYSISLTSISSRTSFSPPKSCPPLISIPSAIFFTSSSGSLNISTKRGRSGIGRLSTQKYPISSNILSAVDFPAPDIPVTITKRMLFPPTSYIILTSGSNSTSNCSFTVAFGCAWRYWDRCNLCSPKWNCFW